MCSCEGGKWRSGSLKGLFDSLIRLCSRIKPLSARETGQILLLRVVPVSVDALRDCFGRLGRLVLGKNFQSRKLIVGPTDIVTARRRSIMAARYIDARVIIM